MFDDSCASGIQVLLTFFFYAYIITQNCDSFIPGWFEEGSEDEVVLKKSFSPFGLGKRACIGMNLAQMEIKLILATLFQKYDFELKFDKDNIETECYFLSSETSVCTIGT